MIGKYWKEYAIPVHPRDKGIFYRLTKRIPMNHRNIWVRKVEPGDIISSRTTICRWKFLYDEKNEELYLGWIEPPMGIKPYRHGKVSLYLVVWDTKVYGNKYKLVKIQNNNIKGLLYK